MVKRRSMVVGLGALATGSGAVFSSAAFANSASSSADLRVVVDQSLSVQKGEGFDPSKDYYTNKENLFDGDSPNDTSGGPFEDSDTPLAYVNDKVNDDLVMKTAVDATDGDGTRFPNLLKIGNNTTAPVDMGIAYDRENYNYGNNGQYGEDVDGSNGDLPEALAQRVYQFEVNDDDASYAAGGGQKPLISPRPGGDGVQGANSTIGVPEDRPAAAVRIPEGESVGLDLVVNINSDDRDQIRSRVPELQTPGSRSDTVDILDGITIGRFEGL